MNNSKRRVARGLFHCALWYVLCQDTKNREALYWVEGLNPFPLFISPFS